MKKILVEGDLIASRRLNQIKVKFLFFFFIKKDSLRLLRQFSRVQNFLIGKVNAASFRKWLPVREAQLGSGHSANNAFLHSIEMPL